MLRCLGPLLLLVTACTAPEAAPSDPPDKTPAPTEQASAASGAWHWQSDSATDAQRAYTVLGRLGELGTERCNGDYEQQWVDVLPSAGRVRLLGPTSAQLQALMDRPVLVLGAPQPQRSEHELPASGGSCVPMQMRSDWRVTPQGIVFDREPKPALQRLDVAAVREFHEFGVRMEADHIIVTLTNPLPYPLEDVELRVHYEGCRGKPGTSIKTTTIGTVAVGAQASARVPRLDEGNRAYSAQVVARGDALTVDLDVPLASMGIDSRCPAR